MLPNSLTCQQTMQDVQPQQTTNPTELRDTEAVHACRVAIIGSGPAGYTAAIYTARAGLQPILITGYAKGGQLLTTSEIENYPGIRSITGPQLMEDMYDQAKAFGTLFIEKDVTRLNTDTYPFEITLSLEKDPVYAESVIIATGASALWLNADGEESLKGRGISTCAVCDGPFFRDKEVVVVGGGDSAMEEALYLSHIASKVTLIHRRDQFRASKIMQDRVLSNKKITVMYNSKVWKWNSDENGCLESVHVVNAGILYKVPCKGGFIAIGHVPNTSFVDTTKVRTDDHGYIIEVENTMTSVPGVFVCGDVSDTRYKQAVTAAGKGCQAAMDCEKWLDSKAGVNS